MDGYKNWINIKSACLGVFNFLYADNNPFISTWLLTHHRGKYRPQYWAIREAHTGEKPKKFLPNISSFETNGGKVGDWVTVNLALEDEALTIDFFYNQRTGSSHRRNQLNKLVHCGNLSNGFKKKLPAEKGAIKIYANVRYRYQNIGVANTSVKVIDENKEDNPTKSPS